MEGRREEAEPAASGRRRSLLRLADRRDDPRSRAFLKKTVPTPVVVVLARTFGRRYYRDVARRPGRPDEAGPGGGALRRPRHEAAGRRAVRAQARQPAGAPLLDQLAGSTRRRPGGCRGRGPGERQAELRGGLLGLVVEVPDHLEVVADEPDREQRRRRSPCRGQRARWSLTSAPARAPTAGRCGSARRGRTTAGCDLGDDPLSGREQLGLVGAAVRPGDGRHRAGMLCAVETSGRCPRPPRAATRSPRPGRRRWPARSPGRRSSAAASPRSGPPPTAARARAMSSWYCRQPENEA